MASEENNTPSVDTKEEKKEETPTDSNKQEEPEKKLEPEATAAEQPAEAAAAAAAPAEQPPPPAPKPSVHKSNFEKDIVYLYQFSRTPQLPSLSPYCLKVETWLRLAALKYENIDHKTKLRSKKGQLPFVELNGEEIADSAIIVKELSQRFEKDLDTGLTNDQKNVSHAMISMIENRFAWVIVWWRAKYPENVIKGYKVNLQHALGTKIPNAILNFLFKFNFGRKGSKKVKAHGIGVHRYEEIMEFGQNDLKVLSDMLADKPFFFGDEPTTLDVVAFANLAQVYFIDREIQYPLQNFMMENCPNLVGHVNRMKERCFPDWDDMCNTLDLNTHLPKPPPEEKESEKKGKEQKKEKEEKEGDKDKEEDKEIEKDIKEIEKEKSEKEEKEIEKESADEKQKEKDTK